MSKLLKIRKRDGTYEFFEVSKIEKALFNSIHDARGDKEALRAKALTKQVVQFLETNQLKDISLTVKDVEDVIFDVLNDNRMKDVVEIYKTFQKKQRGLTAFKTFRNVRDDIGLTPNSLKVLSTRYLLKDNEGNIVETPRRLFERVAKCIAMVDSKYKSGSVQKSTKLFTDLLSNLEFLPNTPTLMNAGTDLGQLSACFVLPIEDSLDSIFTTLKNTALIQQSSGGTGFNFSKLRSKGSIVNSTKGVSSGPISFMQIFDKVTGEIKQGGKRRGANMGLLSVYHPDIESFINLKSRDGVMSNFNLSVLLDNSFFERVKEDKHIFLVDPHTKKQVKPVKASELFDLIVENAWKTGDPGIIFIDEINRHNPTPKIGRLEATNPCGEQALLPYESCNLGSINLVNIFVKKQFNWEKLKKTVRTSIHFLDNVIDANKYVIPELEQVTKSNRKIGLGLMGFAETLIKSNIPYDSEQALDFAEKLMSFIQKEARKKSEELGKERGSFPNFEKSVLKDKYSHMRNATVTTIAPTGSISIIAGVSSGIEPLFAISFIREALEGTSLLETNELFENLAREKGFYSKKLMHEIAKQGSIQKIKGIPKNIKQLFVTALDINPEWHVKIQSKFQKHTDNGVSKTVNLPMTATKEEIKKIFLLAHELKCKGITVYRYGSKKQQVLYFSEDNKLLKVKQDYAGGCPDKVCSV
ncbi:ribonucleoside-diphosphate reductase, adenosylcobalamin-dependent [Candidatus Woesearchaeota archaeon CG10_big_fil_rev_8_21_14_0_10_30_7]|nr:MAG: ribonucleoside-diphosphate reductase, adenosylcobalamin-dependent [Candidatus Woesearchaeota archaeon CG10_big_fil_rev_8_21_14_0_10_30_7]